MSVRSEAAGPQPAAAWLRHTTRREHAAAEAGLDLGRIEQPSDLAGLLQGWATVWSAVRGAASAPAAVPEARAELLLPAAQSIAWLHSDLDDLSRLDDGDCGGGDVRRVRPSRVVAHDPDGAASCSELAGLLTSPAGSWGVAYVLRGSRLGGSVLAPQLRTAVRLPPGCGTAFLASQGTDPGREWVAFRRRLDAAPLGPVDLRAASTAARWTFAWVGAVTSRGLADRAARRPRRLAHADSSSSA